MQYYIDIRLLADSKKKEIFLMNQVYTQLHKALVTLNSSAIGVSFPEYRTTMGSLLRIHGTILALNALETTAWSRGISECEKTDVTLVPVDVKYRTLSRRQPNKSSAKLRRLMIRGALRDEKKQHYKKQMFNESLTLPYLEIKSGSNGHIYRRYIRFSELRNDSVTGSFDTFGLSRSATVPWF